MGRRIHATLSHIELLKALKIIRRGSQLDGDHDVSISLAVVSNYSIPTVQNIYFLLAYNQWKFALHGKSLKSIVQSLKVSNVEVLAIELCGVETLVSFEFCKCCIF